MRPFVEISISKDRRYGTNRKVLFGPEPENAPLNERLISFSIDESDGDDLYSARKGRKNQLEFTFLDETTEIPGFLSDLGEFIQIKDLIFVTYGWITEDGESIGPAFQAPDSETGSKLVVTREFEFRVISIEPSYSANTNSVTVVAQDRSIDLDIFSLSVMIPTLNNKLSEEGARESATDVQVDENFEVKGKKKFEGAQGLVFLLNSLITPMGLTLHPESAKAVTQEDAEIRDSLDIRTRLAIPGETPASYLRNLCEEAGYIFSVENRALRFGPRKIPDDKHVEITLRRGMSEYHINSEDDLKEAPILDIRFEHKLVVELIKGSAYSGNKRVSADVNLAQALEKEINEISLAGGNILSGRDIKYGESQILDEEFASFSTTYLEELNRQRAINVKKGENTALKLMDALFNYIYNQFYSGDEERLIPLGLIYSVLSKHLTPTLKDMPRQSDAIADSLKDLLRRLLEEVAMRGITATVKTIGNPRIRHSTFINLTGNLPEKYKGPWYVHSVKHDINGDNYFTTVNLLAASKDSFFSRQAIEKYKREDAKRKNKKKKQSTERQKPDIIFSQ